MFSVSQGVTNEQWDTAAITVQDLESGKRTVLGLSGSDARYLPTGHIVFAVGGVLRAVRFDLDRLEVTGGPLPVVLGVQRLSTQVVGGQGGASAYYSVSDAGSLIYVPGPTSTLARIGIALIDRDGTSKLLPLPPGTYGHTRVSPDGTRIAFFTDDGKDADVWVYELSGRAQARRLTFGGGNRFPVWSQDGSRLAFQSSRDGDRGIWWQSVENGTAERLTRPDDKDTSHVPDSFAPDGKRLSYTVRKGPTPAVWILSLTDKKAAAFSASVGSNSASAFSPDGRWLAYQSNDTRTAGVFVESFPPSGGPNQIAMRGVATPHHPFWSHDGKELFYLPGPNEFAVVRITTQPAFSATNPELLTRGNFLEGGPATPRNMDVLPDGRFIGIVNLAQSESGEFTAPRINVVLNWFEELKRLAPTK